MADTLYDTDFAEWSDRTAELLRTGRFNEVDTENVAEEIESLGRAARKAVRAQLQRLMMHKIKQQLHPERDNASCHASIHSARTEIQDEILDSPSLMRHLRENLQRVYLRAVKDALEETGLAVPFPVLLDIAVVPVEPDTACQRVLPAHVSQYTSDVYTAGKMGNMDNLSFGIIGSDWRRSCASTCTRKRF